MLELNSIYKSFGSLSVLHNVSLPIPEGKIFGFSGPNGAGKTTVLKLITGLLATQWWKHRIQLTEPAEL